ncbi:MAG TPA: chaperone modulator CbpM [Steroidobacteraceae bacterium]|nr:chaperone modulator CbpM [Steroidobacteraceae bacterium]
MIDSSDIDSFDSGEFVAIARIEHGQLAILVEIGILEPNGSEPWRFEHRDLRRLRSAQRLVRDLGVNLAGAALILDLLDERAELSARIAMLERALDL